jgi:hypothetical protein
MVVRGRGVVMNRAVKLLVIFLAVLFAFSLISSSVLADKPEQTGQDKNKEKKQEKDKEYDPDESPIMEQSRIQDKDKDKDWDGDDDPDDVEIIDEDEEQDFPPAKGLYKPKNNNRNKVKANIQLQNTFKLGAIKELIQDVFEASFDNLEIESPLLPENITADVYVYITSGISGSKVTTPSGKCNLQAKIYEGSGIIILTNIDEDSPGISLSENDIIIMVIESISGNLNMHGQAEDGSEDFVDAFFRAKYLEVTDSGNPLLPEDLIVENALIRIRDGKLYFMGPEDSEDGSPAPPRSNVRITTFARIKSGQ